MIGRNSPFIVRIVGHLNKHELVYQELFYLLLYKFFVLMRLTRVGRRVLEHGMARHTGSLALFSELCIYYANQKTFEMTLAFYNQMIVAYPQVRHAEVAAQLAMFYEQAMEFEKGLLYWRLGERGSANINGLLCQALLKDPAATNASLMEAHRQWAARWVSTNAPRCNNIPANRPDAVADGRPVRIGFTCSFWAASTIRFQFLSWLKHIDRSRYSIYFYVGDPVVPIHLYGYADVVRHTPVATVSDDAFVTLVQNDAIDIFFELNGYSFGHRFVALARRCATVQVSYLNHTATCGVPNVDYIIADDICVPEGQDKFYTERVFRLPRSFFCFNFEEEDMPLSNTPPVMSNGYVTFGFFGSPTKFNNIFIRLMVKVLQATEGSKLLMANSGLTLPENRMNIKKRFSALGIDPSRLLLYPEQNRYGIAKLHMKVDVTLDSWPYCGGNTLAESLWYGVPAITLKGDRFSNRYGASILSAAGLPDMVACSEEEYVQLSVAVSSNVSRLADLRLNLRRTMCRKGMFSDTKAFAHDMARAFDTMFQETAN